MKTFIATIIGALILMTATAQEKQSIEQEFMKAATQGDLSKIKSMLNANPRLVRVKDDRGVSVVLKATYFGRKEVVAVLLQNNPELDIFEASATGQTKRVEELVKKNRSVANEFNVDGFMPLGLATFFGYPETVDVLIKAGADVNATTREKMGVTPLASAAAAKQLGIAKVLIAAGAKVNVKAENDFTPLHETAASGNLEFTKLLLDHGADINARSQDGKTPLSLAIERNQTEMVNFLKERGAK